MLVDAVLVADSLKCVFKISRVRLNLVLKTEGHCGAELVS